MGINRAGQIVENDPFWEPLSSDTSGPEGIAVTKSFFGDLFKGVLCLFMLEMGLAAGQRLAEVRTVGAFLVGFGVVMPIIDGILGVMTGGFVSLTVGGSTRSKFLSSYLRRLRRQSRTISPAVSSPNTVLKSSFRMQK